MFVALIVLAACQVARAPKNGPQVASSLNAKGIISKDESQKKRFFQEAIGADRFYGPAYNNLGLVYLEEGNYFQAAKTFDESIKLMPNDPSPRLHLGMVYEEAGQLAPALEQFNHALELAPDSMECSQAVARVRVKLGQFDKDVILKLREIAARGTDPSWRAWARGLLIKYGTAEDMPPAESTTYPGSFPPQELRGGK
jgi:tetratricopeptide (TPR) repeat protein